MVISYRIAVARAVRYLGSREIASLSEADLKDAEQQLAANGDSYQTACLMFNVIRLSLDYAVGQGMLAVNSAKGYSPNKELYRKTKGMSLHGQEAETHCKVDHAKYKIAGHR